MNASEAEQVYNNLLAILRQDELSWIIEQMIENIAIGKPQTKQVKTYGERDERRQLPLFQAHPSSPILPFEYNKPTGPKADLTATLEYTPHERLLLLIKAIEQAILDTAEMESMIANNLERLANSQNITGINFISDRENQLTFSISQDTANKRITAANILRQHLQQLRKLVYDH